MNCQVFIKKNCNFAKNQRKMKKLYILIALSLLASSCQKSIEDRAEQEAREYTEKLCPTPIQNYTRTDSLTFDRESKTFRRPAQGYRLLHTAESLQGLWILFQVHYPLGQESPENTLRREIYRKRLPKIRKASHCTGCLFYFLRIMSTCY